MWLRDLGLLAWFLVGVGLVLFGATWLLGLTSTIVDPVMVGAILATVAGPAVTKMQAHGLPRRAERSKTARRQTGRPVGGAQAAGSMARSGR